MTEGWSTLKLWARICAQPLCKEKYLDSSLKQLLKAVISASYTYIRQEAVQAKAAQTDHKTLRYILFINSSLKRQQVSAIMQKNSSLEH